MQAPGVKNVRNHGAVVRHIEVARSGIFATLDADGELRVWSSAGALIRAAHMVLEREVIQLAVSWQATHFATTTTAGECTLSQFSRAEPLRRVSNAWSATFDSEDTFTVAAGSGPIVIDASDLHGNPRWSDALRLNFIVGLCRAGNYLIAYGPMGIEWRDPATGGYVAELSRPEISANLLAASAASGDVAFVAAGPCLVCVDSELRSTSTFVEGMVSGLAISDDGQTGFLALEDGRTMIFAQGVLSPALELGFRPTRVCSRFVADDTVALTHEMRVYVVEFKKGIVKQLDVDEPA